MRLIGETPDWMTELKGPITLEPVQVVTSYYHAIHIGNIGLSEAISETRKGTVLTFKPEGWTSAAHGKTELYRLVHAAGLCSLAEYARHNTMLAEVETVLGTTNLRMFVHRLRVINELSRSAGLDNDIFMIDHFSETLDYSIDQDDLLLGGQPVDLESPAYDISYIFNFGRFQRLWNSPDIDLSNTQLAHWNRELHKRMAQSKIHMVNPLLSAHVDPESGNIIYKI